MGKLNIEPLSQRDTRWSRLKLGNGTETIGGYGCVLTCVTMQARYHGKDVLVDQLNEAGKNAKAFVGSTKNLWDWPALTKIYSDIQFIGRFEYTNVAADLQKLDDQLEKKQPVIAKVEADEIGTPKGDHFILIIGKEGDDYWVNDPWWRPSDNHPQQFKLSERYSHNGSKKPEHIILGFRIYEGSIENQDMNDNDKKALEIVSEFAGGKNSKNRKFGNTESAARDLVDVWDRADAWKEAAENAEELAKVKAEQLLEKQKAQFLKEKDDINSKWQSKLDTANNNYKDLNRKYTFAQNIAINKLSGGQAIAIGIAKILKTYKPLPEEKGGDGSGS